MVLEQSLATKYDMINTCFFPISSRKKASEVEIIPKVRHNIKGEGESATTEE